MAFIPIPPDNELQKTDRLYARVDSVDTHVPQENEPVEVLFDCVDADWFDRQTRDANRILSLKDCEDAPASAVRWQVAESGRIGQLELYEGRWVELRFGAAGDEVQHYATVNHLPVQRNLAAISSPKHRTQEHLDRFTSLDSLPTELSEIEEELTKIPAAAVVAVYDVGQGNCNALCDYSGIPFLYFDMGGGALANLKTYPRDLMFCFTARPLTVLSHWDWDHWAAAQRDPDNRPLEGTWIAPNQEIGPTHGKFAAQIARHGRLLIWPQGYSTPPFAFGTICQGSGTGRNGTGLALRTRDDVLLPGDAHAGDIRLLSGKPVRGLVVSHHGGRGDQKAVVAPFPGSDAKLVFSFGGQNSYGHPYLGTVKQYFDTGWRNIVSTAGADYATRGHIAFKTASGARTQPACGGELCSLRISK